MPAGVMCPKCGTMNPSDGKTCATCGTSLAAPADARTSMRKSIAATPPAKSKAALPSAPRRTGEIRLGKTVDESAGRTETGDDPAKTTAEDGPVPPRPKATRTSMANMGAVQDTGGRKSSAGMKAIPRPPASPPSMVSASRDSLVGQKLQEYVIKERIGVGGMGIVYKAVHTLINKEVAIKVLRSDVVTDARDVDRMLDEARIINSIKHRGIINIFGAGSLDDGRHYLIMELLEGESLEQLMQREGTVAAGDSVIILEETLSALAAAHAAGVVHRDLKPANVFLVKEGNKVYVKLLDFGLARRQQQNVTRIAGTPDYISPEHARGRPAGPPADLYAFGVMCFHMLTGKLPFTGNTPMEVMEKHVHHEPPVPHEVNPAIPKALSELILKLLGKDPALRPDANQVKADLRAATKQLRNAATMMSLASIEPVVGEKPAGAKGEKSEEARARELAVKAQVQDVKRQVKKRWPVVVGAVVGVWLLGVLVYVLWPSDPPPPPGPTKPLVKKPGLDKPPEVTTRPTIEAPPKANQVDPTPVANAVNPGTEVDSGAFVAATGPEEDPLAEPDAGVEPNVLAEDNNRVLDSFVIGQFLRKPGPDGQSISTMLERMSADLVADADKREYFEKPFNKAKGFCDGADTKLKLIDCDDQVRKLHTRFYAKDFQ
jgi:serine/threonine protein kinase